MRKNIFKSSLYTIATFFLFSIFSGCNQVSEIKTMTVTFSSFGRDSEVYKLDLTEQKLYYKKAVNFDISEAKFTVVSEFDEAKITSFKNQAKRYGIDRWETYYNNSDIMDGLQWGMVIEYVDGTIQKSGGSNAYPKTWNKMAKACTDLTGVRVLHTV